MVLQAYVDDSTSSRGEQRLHLCAYINSAERWGEFSKAWSVALNAHPKIEYFKTAEAYSGRGEFSGWETDARHAKIIAMARVIHASAPWGVHSSVDTLIWKQHMKGVAPYGVTHPYYPAFQAIMANAARVHSALGSGSPIDFVFDEQEGVGRTAALFHDWAIGSWPAEMRAVVSGTPVFRSDKQVVPIQAADMLAWHVRREAEAPLGELAASVANMLIPDGRHFSVHVEEPAIARMASAMQQMPGAEELSDRSRWLKVQRLIREALAEGWRPLEEWRRY